MKAVICHEFLHVLLRHTEQRTPLTPARHLAFDAVINAIIHREHGPGALGDDVRYYADATDLAKLLRPMNAAERSWYASHSYPADSSSAVGPRLARALRRAPGRGRHRSARQRPREIRRHAQFTGTKGIRATRGREPGPFKLEGGIPNDIGGLLGDHDTLGQRAPGRAGGGARANPEGDERLGHLARAREPRRRRQSLRGALHRQRRADAPLAAPDPGDPACPRDAGPALARAAQLDARLPHPGAVALAIGARS